MSSFDLFTSKETRCRRRNMAAPRSLTSEPSGTPAAAASGPQETSVQALLHSLLGRTVKGLRAGGGSGILPAD